MEPIVAVVILGGLVMIAAPELSENLKETSEINIKAEVKNHEIKIADELSKNPTYTSDWIQVTQSELKEMEENGQFYSRKGLIDLKEDYTLKYIDDSHYDEEQILKGEFIFDETNEKVYYFDEDKK